MSRDEIKHEINKMLGQFSDEALEELLTFLKLLEQQHSPGTPDSDDLQRIISDDNELLQNLQQ